jgi:hypothetical protein
LAHHVFCASVQCTRFCLKKEGKTHVVIPAQTRSPSHFMYKLERFFRKKRQLIRDCMLSCIFINICEGELNIILQRRRAFKQEFISRFFILFNPYRQLKRYMPLMLMRESRSVDDQLIENINLSWHSCHQRLPLSMFVDCWMFKLLSMEDFILLFLRMICHLKCFETANETSHKIHDFVL